LEEAGEYDITIEQGSGFSLPLTYEAPEGSEMIWILWPIGSIPLCHKFATGPMTGPLILLL
jgi:hypothetical protein